MERQEGYEQYMQSVGESLKVSAKVAWITLKSVIKAEKPVLEVLYYQKIADVRRRLNRLKKRV